MTKNKIKKIEGVREAVIKQFPLQKNYINEIFDDKYDDPYDCYEVGSNFIEGIRQSIQCDINNNNRLGTADKILLAKVQKEILTFIKSNFPYYL